LSFRLFVEMKSVHQARHLLVKCLLNYRILFVYFMATTYVFMHYFVSFSDFSNENDQIDSQQQQPPVAPLLLKRANNFNLKKLLNFDKNYDHQDLPRAASGSRKKRSGKILVNRFNIESPTTLKHGGSGELNLKNKTSQFYSQINQDRILLHLLNTSELNARAAAERGVFVEAGAYDGETWSNTLYLERYKGWTGLLIEPSVENYKILKSKNRNAYSVNSCLATGRVSSRATYIEAGPFGITTNASSSGGVSSVEPVSASSSSSLKQSTIYSVTCHPLASILDEFFHNFKYFRHKISRISGVNNPLTVDYLSLDVEGNERSIVETFDWHKYRFNLVNIEFNQNKELYEWLKTYLGQRGYRETLVDDVWYQDLYLAHESVFNRLNRTYSKVSQFIKNQL
jgi:hypothetical protein